MPELFPCMTANHCRNIHFTPKKQMLPTITGEKDDDAAPAVPRGGTSAMKNQVPIHIGAFFAVYVWFNFCSLLKFLKISIKTNIFLLYSSQFK
ncbi:hypothetical protein [Paenibacillus dendrobii]|uniref:hypothetical protein n=1 Tax=Paenibacillus dendrobii TaxID=2691084 RepID=UPI001F1DCCA2|nr:hypothetical protein [Paenibacillus dendrobii]